jgi:3-dehydroquinate dehydratase/shikimate dehydrogenase
MVEQAARAGVVCSVPARDLEQARERLALVPPGCAAVELRADRLRADEVAGLVADSRRELIVTVRRQADGGGFDGSEGERAGVLQAALAAGARFVDVEFDSEAAALADGGQAARVILSHHGGPCTDQALGELYRRMAATRAGRLKIVPQAKRPAELAAIRATQERAGEPGRLTCFASGRAGFASRLTAIAWGGWGSYGALAKGMETAEGQPTASDLVELFDVSTITARTRLFVLIGSSVFGSPSPAMHAAALRLAGLDARYVPLECDSADEALELVGPGGALPAAGLAVTIPFKEAVAARCASLDEVAGPAAAVNTVVVRDGELHGHNTDGPALLRLIRDRLDPSGREVAIMGAGGTARAAAAALSAAGARVRLYNRDAARAERAARSLGVEHAPLAELPGASWRILVQATPLGGRGERFLSDEQLRGELVLDAVYGVKTPLLADASRKGLAVVDGFELLLEQAVRQCVILSGHPPDPATMRCPGLAWLSQQQAASHA